MHTNIINQHTNTINQENYSPTKVNSTINTIISLDGECGRYRNGVAIRISNIFKKIFYFIKDFFSGGINRVNRLQFKKVQPILLQEVQDLQKQKDQLPKDEFFLRVKKMLQVKGKIYMTGWEKSILKSKPLKQEYREFLFELKKLQSLAVESVEDWKKKESTYSKEEKHSVSRWILANEEQVKFSGYSNEIAYKASEVPVGAVLLYNPKARMVQDKMRGHNKVFLNVMQKIKLSFCNFFTGYPTTHALVSIGNGKIVHMDKENEATGASSFGCSGTYQEEDHSLKARQVRAKAIGKDSAGVDERIYYGFDIMLPNYDKFHESLFPEVDKKELSKEKAKEEVEKELQEGWVKTLASAEEKVTTTLGSMFKTVFRSKRPKKGYDIKKVFNPENKAAYSCSGLIGVTFGKHGIDVSKDLNTRVEKVSPTDFLTAPMFDILYANNRKLADQLREKRRRKYS